MMKRTCGIPLFCAAVFCLALCAGAARGATSGKAAPKQAHFPCEGEIKIDKTNLRAGRSLNYEAVFRLDRGTRVMVTGLEKKWYRIESPEDVPCYVSTKFLAEGKVICGRLNVRAKPSPKATVICQLERGDSVEEIEKNDEWTTIKAPDCAELWVSAELVALIDVGEGGGDESVDGEKGESEKGESPDKAVSGEQPVSSGAAAVNPPGEPRPMPAKAEPETAPGPTGTPCRQEGKLVSAGEMGVSGAPYCLIRGFFFKPSVVCLIDSHTVNLNHYRGDRVKIWGYEMSRMPEGIPLVDVRRLEVE